MRGTKKSFRFHILISSIAFILLLLGLMSDSPNGIMIVGLFIGAFVQGWYVRNGIDYRLLIEEREAQGTYDR